MRDGDALHEEGLFYDPEGLSPDELETLRAYAMANGLTVLTLGDFIQCVFYRIGYECRSSIVGFNLPFDLSRIAIDHTEARGSMRGGFSFELSEYPDKP